MNRLILLFFINNVLVTLISCQSENKQSNKISKESKLTSSYKSLPKYFYKRLTGTIAGQPVTMHLNKVTDVGYDEWAGTYYYDKIGNPITLFIEKFEKDSLVFREFVHIGERPNNKIHLKWNGNEFNGKFITETGKNLTINLKEEYALDSYTFNANYLTDSAINQRLGYGYLTCDNKQINWINKNFKHTYDLKSNDNWEKSLKKIIREGLPKTDSSKSVYYNYLGICFNDKHFLSLRRGTVDWPGGAHVFKTTDMYNYDIIQKKQIGINNIIDIDSNSLNKIINKFYIKQHRRKDGSLPFKGELSSADSFYFTNKGFIFLYNDDYFDLDTFIPFEAVKNYLKPDFKKRMGIK